jgi:hypothetical protein
MFVGYLSLSFVCLNWLDRNWNAPHFMENLLSFGSVTLTFCPCLPDCKFFSPHSSGETAVWGRFVAGRLFRADLN